MARSIDERLNSLASRRKGTDRLDRVAAGDRVAILAKSLTNESWERRAVAQPHTRYALGAMQAVSDDYTRISIETAERVGRQLRDRLSMPVSFELQGSVPLDVHIRGVSDVDLLTLDERFLTFHRFGAGAAGYATSGLTSVGVLSSLRSEAERALRAAYPAATVDCSGAKCVALSGGSLARPVDVVPAHWNDTADYQSSWRRQDRGVTILDRKVPATLDQLPFLHIARVDARDGETLGGLKKAIRLVKNVKNDAANEAGAGKLPSFDIAALLYHADRATLRLGFTRELAVLHEAQRFLDWCWLNKDAARRLRTPDNLRTILNTDAKLEGLLSISCELDTLAREVAREQSAPLGAIELGRQQIDEALTKSIIPAAA
jgi:hypothetical protein